MPPRTVLQVNKFHHPRAGAETVYLQTRALLMEHGHSVMDFAMEHPDNIASVTSPYFGPRRSYDGSGGVLRRASDAITSIYSPSARAALGKLLDHERPDVAHLHNIYHQLTLSVVDELHRRGVPMVMTLHDWKVACPAYTLYTEGAPCRRCPEHGVHNVIRHRCVKGSRAASAVAAVEATVAKARGSYGRIQRFIAPSAFGAEVAVLGGIAPERIDVVPNFLTDDELATAGERDTSAPVLMYAGRLDATKGIRPLIEAFNNVPRTDAQLRIAGAGELEPEVRAAAARDPRIVYLGRLPREELFAELRRARALLLPSLWEDNGPLVLLEAQAMGVATIVSDRGGPPEFVQEDESGLVVSPQDVPALTRAMHALLEDRALADRLGRGARARVERDHSAARHYEQLMLVYDRATGDG